jgi:acetoin:2,6-dichlorophenolindophenol oxidoreductase subunit alpha
MIAKTRAGEGPVLIECKTYRYRGHSEHDAALYRDKEELIEWQSRDPIPRFEFYLEKKGHDIKRIREQVDERANKTVQAAVDFAESSSLPEPQEALEDIYAPNSTSGSSNGSR